MASSTTVRIAVKEVVARFSRPASSWSAAAASAATAPSRTHLCRPRAPIRIGGDAGASAARRGAATSSANTSSPSSSGPCYFPHLARNRVPSSCDAGMAFEKAVEIADPAPGVWRELAPCKRL